MSADHLTTLASQIRRYIEKVLPQLERAGGFPDSPMDRRMKGSSNPPVGETALRLWWSYRDYATKLNPLIADLRQHYISIKGYECSEMLDMAVYDSGAFIRWLSEDSWRRDAFWGLSLLLAQVLKDHWGPDVTLQVDNAPDEEETADPRKVAPKWRTITATDAYYSIVARLARIRMEHPAITEAAAEVECQKELEKLGLSGSIGRIRDAKGFVNKERGEGAA